jgi:hypothetical protein
MATETWLPAAPAGTALSTVLGITSWHDACYKHTQLQTSMNAVHAWWAVLSEPHDRKSVCNACHTQCVRQSLRIAGAGPTKHSIHKVPHSTAPTTYAPHVQVVGYWLARHPWQHFLTTLHPTSDVWCNIRSAAVHAQLGVHCSWQRNARKTPKFINTKDRKAQTASTPDNPGMM